MIISINKLLDKSCKCLLVLTALIAFTSCSGKHAQRKVTSEPPKFPTPPEMLVEPEARAGYIIEHVWDEIVELDTVDFPAKDTMEQFLVDYFGISNLASDAAVQKSLKVLFDIATPSMDSIVLHMGENYLSHPNSPIYNEHSYYRMMQVADDSGILDEAHKLRFEEGYRLYLRNREGCVAEDFQYITPDGKTHTLWTTPHEKDLLIIFYHPECESCTSTFSYLDRSERVQKALKTKALTILCLFAEGDEDLWRSNFTKIPKNAIVGMDPTRRILDDNLYNLRALPTLYLLDAENKVLMKDFFPDQIEEYLTEE